MKKISLAWLKPLVSPAAVGIYLTLALTYFSWQFEIVKSQGGEIEKSNPLFELLWTVHQKSIDFRLRMRGPRESSDRVALLTVDEKAVASIGRWPWPREVTASVVERAIREGAKVVAFDAVFAEPSDRLAEDLFNSIKQKTEVPTNLEELFLNEIKTRDSDRLFAEMVSKNSANVVLGVFFDTENDNPPYSGRYDQCQHILFSMSKAYEHWQREEILIEKLLTPEAPSIPETLIEVYKTHFREIEKSVIEKEGAPKNRKDEVELGHKILQAQSHYCHRFLNPEDDELFPTLVEVWPKLIEEESEVKFSTFQEWVADFVLRAPRLLVPIGEDWVMNTSLISQAAKNTAFFNADQDADGTIRKKRLIVRSGQELFPSLALKAYLLANDYNASVTLSFSDTMGRYIVSKFKVVDTNTGNDVFEVPVDAKGKVDINYAGPQKMFPYISAAELLNDSPEALIEQRVLDRESGLYLIKEFKVNKKQFLENKILIFGATAKGIYDLRVTPFDENFPGAETHLNVIDNFERRDFLTSNPKEEQIMPLVILGIGVLLSVGLTHLGALNGLAFVAVVMSGIYAIDRYYFFERGTITSVVLPFLLVLLLYFALAFYRYFTEERGKRELKSTFQKYVSPAIVNEILADPSNIELGGKKMNVTIFFSDVRGFTTISEKLDPRALSDLLNSYLTPMTDLVFSNKGTLDKYIGDAVMAFFGAPIPFKDHAKYGCRCALAHLAKLRELQAEYQKKGLPIIDIGIGLNTGEVSVGNMGSQTVRSYTVMGDAVNLASRLEGITKEYGVRTIISEFTHKDVQDEFTCREVDRVKVKGKLKPVKIFELMAEGKSDAKLNEQVDLFGQGYVLYHKKEFGEALEVFGKLLNLHPMDQVTKLYIERCQDYISEPPPEDWDGVFVMKTK